MITLTRAQHASLVREAKEHLRIIPPHLVPGLLRYLEHGQPPGSFLRSVLENDFREAVARVSGDDLDAGQTLRALTRFLCNYAPSECWGSKEKRLAWQTAVAALALEARSDA